MTTGAAMLVLTAFLASAVEAVEALTATVIVALGPALVLMPIDILRVIVGTLLLVFGLQWLRKAILRAAIRTAGG
jgi:uncharacterized membrane protein